MGNNERKRLEKIKDEKILMKRTVYRTYALQKLIPDKRFQNFWSYIHLGRAYLPLELVNPQKFFNP